MEKEAGWDKQLEEKDKKVVAGAYHSKENSSVYRDGLCWPSCFPVVFNVWVVRFSLTDFNGILQDNAKCSELIQALEQESTLFESYMRNPDTEKKEALERSMKRTKHAVYDLPFQYRRIGELRYAKTWSIRSSYEVYCTKRDAILSMEDNVTIMSAGCMKFMTCRTT